MDNELFGARKFVFETKNSWIALEWITAAYCKSI
jgi:hypothetical protein